MKVVRSYKALIGLLITLLIGCNPLQSVETPDGSTVTSAQPVIPSQSIFPSPSPFQPNPDISQASNQVLPTQSARTKYTLQVALDFQEHRLTVQQTITYINPTGIPLGELVLAVEPSRYENCFRLSTLAGDGVDEFQSMPGRFVLKLNPALGTGDRLIIDLQYSLQLPYADQMQLFGYKTGQINLVDWYPFIVPYINGWVLHEPGEVGEHLVYDLADFEIQIRQTEPSIPLVYAAGAPVVDGKINLVKVRSAAISVSDRVVQAARTSNGVTITSYYFPGEGIQATRLLDDLVKAVNTFRQIFGPYPHETLSVVETEYYDGMEVDGIFFLSRSFYLNDDGTKLNHLIDIGVHETAHQWWFGVVGNDQAMEPWLDEALSTYSEYLYYEKMYPGMTDAWWKFRVEAFSPSGDVNGDIYAYRNQLHYMKAIYLRGATFLHEVRNVVGEAAFFSFLADYAGEMSGRIATRDDFFFILSRHSSADISDLRNEYFQP